MNEDLWVYLVLVAIVVFLWNEYKLKTLWVIVAVLFLFSAPKETLLNLPRFLAALTPEVLLIGAVLAALWIGRDWAERHRAQFDCKQACKKAWDEKQKYRKPESAS